MEGGSNVLLCREMSTSHSATSRPGENVFSRTYVPPPFHSHCVRLSDDILKRVSTVVAPGHGERGE